MRYLDSIMHYMLQRILFPFLCAAIILAGCKKNDTVSAPKSNSAETDDCMQSAAVNNGDIIEGKYIILYKKNTEQSRGLDGVLSKEISENALARNNISKGALEKSFGGEQGGFIANLSKEEAAKLRNDESIEAIEPDRIISLSTCFT